MAIRLTAIATLLVLSLVARAETPGIALAKDRIDFKFGPREFATYHWAASQVKPYLWPVNAPNGVTVTRAWPMEAAKPGGSIDHIHQKSGWFTYGDVIPKDVEVTPKRKGVEGVDFWSEVPIHGRIVCTTVEEPNNGRVVTRNQWRLPNGGGLLNETRTISQVDLGTGWLLVVTSDFEAAYGGVIFGDTKEGAFGVRVNDQLRLDPGGGKQGPEVNRITNSTGKSGEKECWGRQADWCDFSGVIDNQAAGIALFDDPSNKHRACWHVRGYGLMAANPFGREKSGFPDMKGKTDRVELAKGEHLILRYGLYTHAGDVKAGKVAEAFSRFVELGKK